MASYYKTPTQIELKALHQQIAAKRVEIAALFARADEPGGATDQVARAVKSGNAELLRLVDRAELLSEQIRDERGPANRQIIDDDTSESGGTGDSPGIVRGLKSADKFGGTYGPSTPVTLDRYLRAAFTGNWDDLPDSLWAANGQKAMATDALGTLVLPTPLSNRIIDLTRAASRVVSAGATTVRMTTGEMTFGRLTQAPTPAWKVENDLITPSDAEFEPVTLTARTLAARVVLSVELAEDSPTIGNAIEAALTAELASEVDRAALLGTGTPPEPRGLVNMTGVTVLDTSAGLPANYNDFSRAVQAIREANHEPNAVLLGPDVIGELERLVDLNGNPLVPPDSYRELRKLSTTKLADSAAIGDWSQFVIGLRQEIRIEASRQANDENGKGFSSYSVLVRATLRTDFAVLKPAAFYVLTDIDAELAGS